MVRGLSKITIIGNVGRDPEMRYTPNGNAVTEFSVAVNRRSRSRDGEWQDETNWFRVSAWGRLGENVNQYLTKGSPVCVEGRFWVRQWTSPDGREGSTNEINANDVVFLSGRDTDGGGGFGGDRPRDDFGGGGDMDPDDLPF